MKNELKIDNRNNGSGSKISFAILLVLTGVLLLSFNMGFIPAVYKPILISWQMLLVVLGISFLCNRQLTSGIILISVGTFFILPVVGQSFPDLFNGTLLKAEDCWPVLLIIGGILFLFKKNDFGVCQKQKYRCSEKSDSDTNKDFSGTNQTVDDCIDKSVLFNGSEQIVFSSNFRGGEVNCAFGEIKLDLRKVSGLNKNNNLEVNAMFGSVIIYVPGEWQINLKSSVMFGDIQDKRVIIDIPTNEDNIFLNMKASCLFGSIEIRN
ncbi:cell wall-active antibiotic response 4TMS protein YvqF [Dysgonomonas alginatilytica]|uniref:Cell wall-active antibiotic response 4TMS protein YvqF n=1 Tax=Dysgonomonas alginatilytica TaxID=1605892 RepID=A0A2V3PQA9_9BACT|nr:LiaF domain-containing protein [Dysgonomonas alginatilytica]PXV65409.1 cell wall-active antibiotic response 4TMS protein YvqF [Dysgonomonas alginatilytica]